MSAGNDLLIKMLLSPELDFTDKTPVDGTTLGQKTEKTLEVLVQKMIKEDRVELMQALGKIHSTQALPPSLSDRGIEVLLIADDEQAPINPEYNYTFSTFANYTRGHSNGNILAEISRARKALLKMGMKIATPQPQEILASIQAAIGKVDEKLAQFDQAHQRPLINECLELLRTLGQAVFKVTQQNLPNFDESSIEVISQLSGKILQLFGHSGALGNVYSISRLMSLLSQQFLTSIHFEAQSHIQLSNDELVAISTSENPDNLYRGILLKIISQIIITLIDKINVHWNEKIIERAKIEEEKELLKKRLQVYEAHVVKLEKKSDLQVDEFYDVAQGTKEAFKEIEAICNVVSLLLNPQNLQEMQEAIADVQDVVMKLRDDQDKAKALKEILRLLRAVAGGNNLIAPLLQEFKDLNRCSGNFDLTKVPEFNRLIAYQKMSFDVFDDQTERFKLVKDCVGLTSIILEDLKTKLSHELYDMEGAPKTNPIPAPSNPLQRLAVLQQKEQREKKE